LIHDVGLLGNATVVMPEMIVATDEIVGMLHYLCGQVEVTEESLALGVMEEVGPGGEFVTHPHTFDHFRDVWYPELLFRAGAEAWAASGRDTFEDSVNAKTCRLMERYEPPALPKEGEDGIREVVAGAEASLSKAT
jgi:trimethylamine--corrinoid protein Co-methyltransferase